MKSIRDRQSFQHTPFTSKFRKVIDHRLCSEGMQNVITLDDIIVQNATRIQYSINPTWRKFPSRRQLMDKKNRKIQYLGIHTMNITFFQRFANLDDEPFVTKKGRIAAVLF